MEKVAPFNIKHEYIDKKTGDGYLFILLNDVRCGSTTIDYEIIRALRIFLNAVISRGKYCSEELFLLDKTDVTKLFYCSYFEDFSESSYLEKYETEFITNEIHIPSTYYNFDGYLILFLRSESGERLIISNEINEIEEVFFTQRTLEDHLLAYMKRLEREMPPYGAV